MVYWYFINTLQFTCSIFFELPEPWTSHLWISECACPWCSNANSQPRPCQTYWNEKAADLSHPISARAAAHFDSWMSIRWCRRMISHWKICEFFCRLWSIWNEAMWCFLSRFYLFSKISKYYVCLVQWPGQNLTHKNCSSGIFHR